VVSARASAGFTRRKLSRSSALEAAELAVTQLLTAGEDLTSGTHVTSMSFSADKTSSANVMKCLPQAVLFGAFEVAKVNLHQPSLVAFWEFLQSKGYSKSLQPAGSLNHTLFIREKWLASIPLETLAKQRLVLSGAKLRHALVELASFSGKAFDLGTSQQLACLQQMTGSLLPGALVLPMECGTEVCAHLQKSFVLEPDLARAPIILCMPSPGKALVCLHRLLRQSGKWCLLLELNLATSV